MPVSTRSQTESTSYSFSAPSSVSFGAHFPCSSVTYSMHAPLPSSTPYLYPSFPPMTTNMYPFSSSYPGFQIQSPMYAHSIDMYSNYNFSENSLQDIDSSKADQPVVFYLHWLSGTTIRICYGCANPIRDNTSIVPPPPHDIVVRFKERRYYRDPTSQELKLTKKEENTYYHFMKQCVLLKHPGFHPSMLHVPDDMILTPLHRFHLCEQFGVPPVEV